jgi:uncharacterized protein YukE
VPSTLRFLVPSVDGDPDAAFALARAYRELADAVTACRQQVAAVLAELSGSWSGPAHRALSAPSEEYLHDSDGVVRTLESCADELERYGSLLQRAHQHHGWSLHKLAAIGAVVAVSAGAIVVTAGAATVVEAAAASAEVGCAAAAAGEAAAASLGTANALEDLFVEMPAVRALASFVLPQLKQVVYCAAPTAAGEQMFEGTIHWRDVAVAGATGPFASAIGTKAVELAGGTRWAARALPPVVWAGDAAADEEISDQQVQLSTVLGAFVMTGSSGLAHELLAAHVDWAQKPDFRRLALIHLVHQRGRISDPGLAREIAELQQPPRQLLRGDVDFRLQEGRGHTLARHVGLRPDELRARLSDERMVSSFWDESTARDAFHRALEADRPRVERWLADTSPTRTNRLPLSVSAPYDVGYVLGHDSVVRFTHEVRILLERSGNGFGVKTSYPRIRASR